MTHTLLATPPSPPPAADDEPFDLGALFGTWRRRGALALAAWVLGFGAWAMLAPISGAVVGSGMVKVESNRQSVTHRDGGFVSQILVHEGDVVRRGQPLIVLDDARVDSSVDLLVAQLVAERLRHSRLEAEAAMQAEWAAPRVDDAASAPERARDATLRERAAFDARRRSLLAQVEAAQAQIRDTTTEVEAYQRNNASTADALKLLKDEIGANEALLQENFVNRTRVLGLRRGLSDYESRIETNRAELSKALQRRAELEGRIAQLRLTYVQTASEDLRDSNARLVDFEERLRAARDAAGRQVVAAPVAGRLVGLRVNTVGSAVGPREPIVDIVPSDVPLVVDARVSAEAATELRTGQAAEVKLLGYHQRSTGMLPGRVVDISADALVEQRSGSPYFAVQVEVDPAAVAAAGLAALTPGMATEVFIRTSSRTPLDFLLEPLTEGLRRSFREH
jgi:HlyD family type I secretion membrane fusion protein